MKKRQAGLSMMELLVVLTLVSLVSVLLLEATTFLFGNYSRVQAHLVETGSNRSPDRWFRNSVAHLVAASDPEAAFVGASDAFEGFTLSPVTVTDGTLTHVRWYLEQEGEFINLMLVQNGAEPILINRWQATGAAFSYLNARALSQAEWSVGNDDKPVLPAAVQLIIEKENLQTIEILAAVELKPRASADYRDLL